MVMRLVRDDDYEPMELEEQSPPSRPGADVEDPDAELEASAEASADVSADASEQQDGAVDVAEEVDATDDTAADDAVPDVNVRSLEALLLTTHHPLTAGRIAEVLDLPSTKPIRKAIRQLNDAYA